MISGENTGSRTVETLSIHLVASFFLVVIVTFLGLTSSALGKVTSARDAPPHTRVFQLLTQYPLPTY